MTKSKKIIVSSFVTVLAAGTIGISITNASIGSHREQVQNAIRNNDFQAFKEVADSYPMARRVKTQKDFEAISQAHDLRQAGDHKQAMEVLQGAGIERTEHQKAILRHNRSDIRSAVENNNFIQFQKITNGKGVGQVVNTQDEFDSFVEMHELRKQKRYEEANKIRKELGLHGKRR